MGAFMDMRALDGWCSRLTGKDIRRRMPKKHRKSLDRRIVKARSKDGLQAFSKLPEPHTLVDNYQIVDWGMKVVGVYSAGTRCFVVLMMGRKEGDPLFSRSRRPPHRCGRTTCRRARTTPTTAELWGAFDKAVTEFAVRYADQNERNYRRLLAAIESGEVEADLEA
jgi:hypothetical protein